jgi:hypothetical protein
VVTWNEEKWTEERVSGDLNTFAKQFFDDEEYEKIELGFLQHNINIWFTKPYGNSSTKICGSLLKKPVERCIIFTMITEEYRGNITLDEVKKIIYLSDKLDNYMTPSHLLEEKNDSLNRKIINNKYKILDYLYHNIK